MKVTLRQRLTNNKINLYLDYYKNGNRKIEYLKLYMYSDPKTKEERTFNKKTLTLAETICSSDK